MHMQSITSNNLNLIEKFLYIINNRYSEIICAKYDSSIMNDVHTVCLADYVSLPAKVIWLTAFFLKKKAIFYGFCVGCWLANITWCWAKAFDVHRSKVN